MPKFSGRLQSAPVAYVLCQVRFSPIEKLAEYVPEIQDRLRSDYPLFERQELTGIDIGPSAEPKVQHAVRWSLADRDRRTGFFLSTNSYVSHCVAYSTFDDFLRFTLLGFNAVHEAAKVGVVQRLGLRYIDVITADAEDSVDSLVDSHLCGFSPRVPGVELQVNQQLVSMRTSIGGTMVLRVSRGRHLHDLPPDLGDHGLARPSRVSANDISVILDTDHYVDQMNADPEIAAIEQRLRELHKPIHQIFEQAITDVGLSRWRVS